MNQEFFKPLIGKQVSVDYNLGKKGVFINGKVTDAEEKFVTIASDDAVVSVLYSSVTAVRILTENSKFKQADDERQQLEQQQEERKKRPLK